MAKAPLGVIVKDTPGTGSSKPLGAWPDDFLTRYAFDSYIGRMNGIRKQTLPHLQRFENQNIETQAAKASGRPANLLGNDIRSRNLQEAIKTRDTLQGMRVNLGMTVEDKTAALKPFDPPKTSHEIALQAEYRGVLRSADPKTQADLLKQFEFRQAAMADGAAPSLSNIAPTQFERMRHQRLLDRFPNEMQMAEDFKTADELVGNHLAALDAMIETERRALGIPAVEPKTKTPEPWE
jgi:hypothetical protein